MQVGARVNEESGGGLKTKNSQSDSKTSEHDVLVQISLALLRFYKVRCFDFVSSKDWDATDFGGVAMPRD